MKQYYKYFVEEGKLVSLKDVVKEYTGLDKKRIERLHSILGDVEISDEFLKGYLEYFTYSKSRRGSLALTKESLKGLYEISSKYPELGSEALKEIMGEYVKDLFDEADPMSYFSDMSLREKDSYFTDFMDHLRKLGDASDIKYKEEKEILDLLTYEYGSRFTSYIEPLAVKYHKTVDEIFASIPDSTIVRKDADIFYEIASRELFGAVGYPYSYQMCESMLLHDSLDGYPKDLFYDSTTRGRFKADITKKEFLQSIEEKREKLKIRKK